MRSRNPWTAELVIFFFLRNAGSAVHNVHNKRTLLGILDLSEEKQRLG